MRSLKKSIKVKFLFSKLGKLVFFRKKLGFFFKKGLGPVLCTNSYSLKQKLYKRESKLCCIHSESINIWLIFYKKTTYNQLAFSELGQTGNSLKANTVTFINGSSGLLFNVDLKKKNCILK